jgi:hypothetical protein
VTGRPLAVPHPAADLLAGLAALGPYFAVESAAPAAADSQDGQCHRAGAGGRGGTDGRSGPDGSGGADDWQPVAMLLRSPAALRRRAEAVRAALAAAAGRGPGGIELRVAASVCHLGLAARLIAPVLGAAVAARVPLPVDPERARWIPAAGGPSPLALPTADLAGPAFPGSTAADPVVLGAARALLRGPVLDLTDMTAAMSVSRRVLLGNVASAVNGAASMIAAARADLAADAAAAGQALLSDPPLAAAYTGTPAADFRRRSCCLIYRIAAGGGAALCGDCVRLTETSPDGSAGPDGGAGPDGSAGPAGG